MKRLENAFPNMKTTLLCVSAAYIAIGAVLLLFPQVSLPMICMTIGVLAIIIGIINIASYFVKKGYLSENQLGFSIGAAELLFGLYAVLRNEDFAFTFTQVLAICMVFDSILKLQYSIDLLRLKCSKWWGLLVTAVVTAGLSMAILVAPFDSEEIKITYTYIILIVDGILNILSVIWLKLQMKRYHALLDMEKEEPEEMVEEEEE